MAAWQYFITPFDMSNLAECYREGLFVVYIPIKIEVRVTL